MGYLLRRLVATLPVMAVVAVVVFALVKSRQKPEDAVGADEQGAESAGTPDSGRMPGAARAASPATRPSCCG